MVERVICEHFLIPIHSLIVCVFDGVLIMFQVNTQSTSLTEVGVYCLFVT